MNRVIVDYTDTAVFQPADKPIIARTLLLPYLDLMVSIHKTHRCNLKQGKQKRRRRLVAPCALPAQHITGGKDQIRPLKSRAFNDRTIFRFIDIAVQIAQTE